MVFGQFQGPFVPELLGDLQWEFSFALFLVLFFLNFEDRRPRHSFHELNEIDTGIIIIKDGMINNINDQTKYQHFSMNS